MVLSYGDADQGHCYLDWLMANWLLGPEEEAGSRYDAGYHLRDVYYSYRSNSGRDLVPSSRTGFLTEHETDADKAEQAFKAFMSALPVPLPSYGARMCVGEPRRFPITRATRSMVYEAWRKPRDALDELGRAIRKAGHSS